MLWHGGRGGDDSLKVLDGRARTKMVGAPSVKEI
jgi:hypothetical protein